MNEFSFRCKDDDLGAPVLLSLTAVGQAESFEIIHQADYLARVEVEEVREFSLRGLLSATRR